MSQPVSTETPAAAPPSAGTPAIETVGLSKRYGDRVALQDLTLQVQPG